MFNYLTILFAFIIIAFLIVDLGFFNKKSQKISFKSALYQTIFWIAVSLGFGALIYFQMGNEAATQYLSAYLTEKMLSVDNLFVILLIFNFFNLEEKYHHKVLFWGILGAIVFRGIFIGVGAIVVSHFQWVLYIFGAILFYTGIKLFWDKKEEHIDFKNNKAYKAIQKLLPFTDAPHEGRFTVKQNNKWHFTTLFAIVLLVESTDIIFAVDSIPAAFAITQDPFLVFTSNIFAVMGLRALFFLLENVLHKFHHLQKGLSFILIFIGLKMLAGIFHFHISSIVSFAIILVALLISLLLSMIFPKKI